MMASVAGPSATAWAASVVTENDTRYLSWPDVAMTLRREVFSVMSSWRYVPSMIDDGNPLKSACEALVGCHAASCWLST